MHSIFHGWNIQIPRKFPKNAKNIIWYLRAEYFAFYSLLLHSFPCFLFFFFFFTTINSPGWEDSSPGNLWRKQLRLIVHSFHTLAREPRHLPRELQPRIKISSRSCVAGIHERYPASHGWYFPFSFQGENEMAAAVAARKIPDGCRASPGGNNATRRRISFFLSRGPACSPFRWKNISLPLWWTCFNLFQLLSNTRTTEMAKTGTNL